MQTAATVSAEQLGILWREGRAAAQQRLALCIRRPSVSPNFGQTAGERTTLSFNALPIVICAILCGEQRSSAATSRLSINAVELALGKRSLVALAFLAGQGVPIKEIVRRTGRSRKHVRQVIRGERTEELARGLSAVAGRAVEFRLPQSEPNYGVA